MAFVQKSDNGICTCGLQVETYGWTENARSSWSTPTPIASHFGTGYVVQDFDRGPRLAGTSRRRLGGVREDNEAELPE